MTGARYDRGTFPRHDIRGHHTMNDTYEAWCARVESVLDGITGFGIDDYADVPLRDWYTDGITPRDAAEMVLENEGFVL